MKVDGAPNLIYRFVLYCLFVLVCFSVCVFVCGIIV